MKIKLKYIFLIFAWIYFFAFGYSIISGVMLILSALYFLIETLYDWRKKNAGRKSK